MRVDQRWSAVVWPLCMAAGSVIPFISASAYLFGATALVSITASTGQALPTAVGLLLVIGATAAARADRHPIAWLLARPDRSSLLRLGGVLAGFPIAIALSRVLLLKLGLDEKATWAAAIALGTAANGAVTFYFSQREQHMLIQRYIVLAERAEAERRYRLLADNAVDIIVHLRGTEADWVSPSVEAALGGSTAGWTGTGFSRRIHPLDRDTLAEALGRVAGGEAVFQRFRVRADDDVYHWVEGHAKPYVDASGDADGLIAALRIVDRQVEAEERLDRLARFDTLTGLANRAEAIARLESAMQGEPEPGTQLGVLFCDIDDFKEINDTWGHGGGDAVLTALANRIVECVGPADTVGRTGGDEILVLLPGSHSIDEVVRVAEKIRTGAAQPIGHSGGTIRATLSIGATIAVAGEPVSAITARADAAMYQAKLGSKNCVIRIELSG